jgi:hypothetical protein
LAALGPGCDQDVPKPPSPPADVHLVATNLASKQLPANGTIELAFDRLLLPSCITRQTFQLGDLAGNALTPTVAYDPVSRVVTITPLSPLTPGQDYEIGIASPQSSADQNGLRAIDGATLAVGSTNRVGFQATVATSASVPAPTVDFCNDVFTPVFGTCGGNGCHGTAFPAAGLLLTTVAGVAQTAVGRVAHGSNQGPRAAPSPAGLHFGEDMPIVDPGTGSGGDPADSWLLYKMLMAVPEAGAGPCDAGVDAPSEAGAEAGADAAALPEPSGSDAGAPEASSSDATTADSTLPEAGSSDASAEDAGAEGGTDGPATAAHPTTPTSVCGLTGVTWQPLSDAERATLAGLVPGREMPYPASLDAGAGLGASVDTLERVSLWIRQGAPVPSGGCTP